MTEHRLVVCLDVESSTPAEAYRKVYDALSSLAPQGITWESTDEWFDDNGVELSEETISAARAVTLDREFP